MRELIEAANGFARHREWKKASHAFQEARTHEQFDWEAAERQFDDENLCLEMAAAFLMGDNIDAYQSLCSLVLELGNAKRTPSSVKVYSTAALMMPTHLPVSQRHRVIELARWAQGNVEKQPFRSYDLVRGIADYRDGKFKEALTLLATATESYKLTCSGFASAFKAMCEQNLDFPQNAKQSLNEAKAKLNELLADHPDDLGHLWHQIIFLELAIKEADEVLGGGDAVH